MAVIKSGATTDQLTVDATSKAARVTLYDSGGVELKNKKTYCASAAFTPAATATDLITVYGSATKTIRVQSIKLGTANTAAGSQNFFTIKRSAVNTTGTFVGATAVPLDSADAAATATVGHYTANPGGLGTAVGTIAQKKVASPVVTPTSFAGIVEDSDKEMLPVIGDQVKPVVLRGVTEGVAVNFNGAALVSGQIHTYTIIWTEE